MKFTQAIRIANKANEDIKKAYERVLNAQKNGERTPCYFFAIDGIVYYFGFDGVELRRGSHITKRSAYILEHADVTVIR